MSDFLDYFDKEYLPKLSMRGATFRAALRELKSRNGKVIVETGCVREKDNWDGDGQSTIIFDAYARFEKGQLWSIDILEEATTLAKQLCPSAYIITDDSLKYLNKADMKIDLLYLDASGVDDPMHCLFEFCAAKHLLHSGSIVMADDSPIDINWVVRGKGEHLARYLRSLDIKPFAFGYQAAWIIP